MDETCRAHGGYERCVQCFNPKSRMEENFGDIFIGKE
jgi:hypothetical protein